MAGYRGRLERESERYELRPGAFDRLIERHRKKERRRQIGSGILACVVFAAGAWGALALVRKVRPATHLSSVSISISNVTELHPLWTAQRAAYTSLNVVYSPEAGGLVFVADNDANSLLAYRADCGRGGADCQPEWSAPILRPYVHMRSVSGPAAGEGSVFVGADRLYAFSASCQPVDGICRPLWKSPPTRSFRYSTPAVGSSRVFVTTDTRMYAFPSNCGMSGATCNPVWVGLAHGGLQAPATDGEMVYVASDKLYAFSANCGTGGAACRPAWTADVSSSAAPAVDGGMVYIASDKLYAFRSDCGRGGATCSPSWSAEIGASGEPGFPPVVTDGVVYVGGDRLYAFPANCGNEGSTCQPLWRGPRQASFHERWLTPTVVNGVVFTASDRAYAFAVGCDMGGPVCEPLWVGPVSHILYSRAVQGLTASGQALYVVSGSGVITAFGIPTRP
jgi:outer membrane protein assembly factor BamB